MKVLTILGTRPEIIRLSTLIPKFDQHFEHTLVHSGQNSTDNLSGVFFRELKLRDPDTYLNVSVTSLAAQVSTLFLGFEKVLDEVKPDRILMLGDTNSALVAFLCKRRGLPVFHMEAGNRCFDNRVPEEVNRKVIDHCSSILLPYTERSAENLVREGIPRERIFVTGNPIFEVLEHYKSDIDSSDALHKHGVREGHFVLATMHRAENVDDPETLDRLCIAMRETSKLYDMPLILSVHPRIKSKLKPDVFQGSNVRTVDAMPFFEFVKLEKTAALVLSDSGTVQEECAIFGTPVITIRETTERPETVESGSNIISSTRLEKIVLAAKLLRSRGRPFGNSMAPQGYLDVNVSDKILNILTGNSF